MFTNVGSKSDCKFRGRELDPGLVPYFRGDWSWNNFYGHSPPSAYSRRVVVSYKGKYVHEDAHKIFIQTQKSIEVYEILDVVELHLVPDCTIIIKFH